MHTSFVIAGKARPPLWRRDVWLAVVPELDPLVRAAGKDVGVRSVQGGPVDEQVSFGRLGWDPRSHAKWTHEAKDTRRFLSCELWGPRWTKAGAQGPELFLAFEEPFILSGPRKGQFNQVLHLAVSHDLGCRVGDHLLRALGALHQAVDGVLTVARRAPWLSRGDCIQDLIQNHLRPGFRGNALVPDPRTFQGRFVPFQPGAPLPEIPVDDDATASSRPEASAASSTTCPVTLPVPTREPYVFDKAKWHSDGDYPESLSPQQAFVHTGMFLGWLVERDLVSEEFRHETPEQIARFEAREITGPDVFRAWDGCLDDSMLSERGNAFAKDYYCFERGPFLADYEELLAGDLPSLYHVADTWKNYDRLRVRLDERFDQWLGGSRWK